MRVRKKPWAAQELLDNTLVINDAPEKKGKWKEYFGNDHPIYVEIGCGKGGFLRKKSLVFANFTNHWGMLLNCFFYIVSAKGKIHKKENDNKKYLPALRLYLNLCAGSRSG